MIREKPRYSIYLMKKNTARLINNSEIIIFF